MNSGKAGLSALLSLSKWLEAHPQREDLYAALRPLLADRPRQDRTFLDQLDQLQPSLRTLQLIDPQELDVPPGLKVRSVGCLLRLVTSSLT